MNWKTPEEYLDEREAQVRAKAFEFDRAGLTLAERLADLDKREKVLAAREAESKRLAAPATDAEREAIEDKRVTDWIKRSLGPKGYEGISTMSEAQFSKVLTDVPPGKFIDKRTFEEHLRDLRTAAPLEPVEIEEPGTTTSLHALLGK